MNKLLNALAKLYASSPGLRRWTVAPLALALRILRVDREALKQKMGTAWEISAKSSERSSGQDHVDPYGVNFHELIRPYLQADTRIAMLTRPTTRDAEMFRRACDALGIHHKIIDIDGSSFLEEIREFSPQVCFVRPSHDSAQQRTRHLERIQGLSNLEGMVLYPSLRELSFYESKLSLAYFLQANNIPHPPTWSFLYKHEALEFVATADLPLVFKITSGSGASGVEFVRTIKEARDLINLVFDRVYYNRQAIDPRTGDYGYMLLQQFVPNSREFRIIKIGNRWFGHEKHKMADQEFFSGSGHNLWTAPPKDLLDFCHGLATRYGFMAMCFDIFATSTGEYLVNELQTWFGSFSDSQMYIDSVPGAYVRSEEGEWKFQAGNFNTFGSNTLRILDALEHLSAQQTNIV